MHIKQLAPAVLAGVLLFFCGGCASEPPAGPLQSTAPLTITPAEDLTAELSPAEESEFSIHMQRLSFSGSPGAEAINEQLLALQQERLANDLANARTNYRLALHSGRPADSGPYYTNDTTLYAALNDGQTLSLVFDTYEYTQDAAHPMSYRYGYTFDAVSGQRLSLEDVWGDPQAAGQITALIYQQIEQAAQLDDFFPDLAANLSNMLGTDDWYLDTQGLRIVYTPYEIAAYAAGIQEFLLPLPQAVAE